MFQNYLKIALRNLKRNKTYALLNVLGLTVGIGACLLVFLVIQYETSFDNFHNNKENIYRIGSEFHNQDGVSYSSGVAFPVGAALRVDFPQIKQVASILKSGGDQVTIEDATGKTLKKFSEPELYFAEPSFFSMFNFPFLAGSAKSLSEPNTVVLSQAIAEKYFGDWKTAVGKTIKYQNKDIFKVTGVIKNAPANTDFPLEVVISYITYTNANKERLTDWVSTYGQHSTFVELPQEFTAAKLNAALPAFTKKHKPDEYSKDGYIAQPLTEIHFDDRFGNYRGQTFSKELITALLLIGIFLIVVACVNFINLATAQAVNRSKEVGVRKVLGSSRKQLAFQFLSETAIITIFALLAAIAVAAATLPFLNKLLETKMILSFADDPVLLLFLFVVAILVIVLSGLYPAMILSGFNPITALKSKITSKMAGGISLRRGLVILQFTIAHVLIIGTLIVVSQADYFRNASLGFDKAAIINVYIPGDSLSRSKIDYLNNQLSKNSNVESVSFSFASPSDNSNWQSDFKYDHAARSTDFSANLKWADENYFKLYGLEFVAGRPYYPSDTVREFVVNETLLRKLGITNPKDAIGKQIDFWDGGHVANIVGVVKDFNAYSLKEPMAPVVLSTWKDVYQMASIKIKPGKEKETLAAVEKIWNEIYPSYVYSYQFLDEKIAGFYKQENQLAELYQLFAGIAIFISCLGLYGLISFMVVQRTKEVGIRKVLGASVSNIIFLLSKEFTILILIAFAVAAPLAWYFMHQWLQDYTYRITPGIGIFLSAILASVVIAWITVGYRAIKAAIANPVKSLRTE
ncbi:FtsX-like permease family protein [Panacibacter ginsenosidivorans]|uniref:FtsX-like permease family protein n=1 Tax=Panacibacter ginsenosidivorans TaxID=1813871 RepID=A0A5B8VEU0_9BACT|nr:ABC transporter permease [Panacibacter ginsenosidivorans]QEC70004.1 FtsX-like permease family protein [Panacibacter ginsenosidivorans]